MISRKLLLIILSVLFAVSAFSSGLELPQSHRPIEWQIIDLQEKIEKKVKSSLDPIVDQSDYVVQVRVEIDEAKKIELTPKSAPGGGGEDGAGDEADDPAKKKKEEAEKNNKKQGVRFTDNSTQSTSQDYILFSKLGMEAPIYGVEEPQANGAAKIELGGLAAAKPEKGGAPQPKSEVDMVQKTVVELNDKYNLFKYLLGVDITLFLDEQIVNASRKAIEKIIDNISFNLGPIEPNIRIEYVPLTAKKKAKAALKLGKDGKAKKDSALSKAGETLSQFSEIIGMVLAALIIGIFALLTMKKYEDIRKEAFINLKGKQESGDGAGAGAGAAAGAGAGAGDGAGDGDGDGSEGSDGLDGIERFRKYLENSQREAILLVKKWIKEKTYESNGALKALVNSLSNDELLIIFDAIKLHDRNSWKKVTSEGVNGDELKAAVQFISKEIVDGIMVPNVIKDEECIDLILDLTAKEAAEFCQSNMDHGAILLNVLNSNFINEIFDNMKPDTVNVLIARSSEFQQNSVAGEIGGLKAALQSYQKDAYRAPFLDRVVDLIRLSKGDNETSLFSALSQAEDFDYVMDIARNYFPSELIPSVSVEAFKMGTENMELKDMAEFFVSMEDDERYVFLDKFAEEGTKAREMIELEIEQIFEDEVQSLRLKKDHREIWQRFLQGFRTRVRTDQMLYKEVKDDMERWVEGFYGGASVDMTGEIEDFAA